jgi:hypothetical protein
MLNVRALGLVAVLAVAACAGVATPSPSPGAPSTPRPTPTAVPGDPGGGIGGTDPGSGGGSGGGGGIPPLPGGGANENPLLGNATYLEPAQGLVDQHPVRVQLVRALVNPDGTVTADLRWWSGVAPCSQLDHVEIDLDAAARSVRLQVIEGSGAGDIACIDIAQLSATTVNLDLLAHGTWTISADGDAPPITLDVPLPSPT